MNGGSYRFKVGKEHIFRQQAMKKRSDVFKKLMNDGIMIKNDETYNKLLKPNYAYLIYNLGGESGEIIAHSWVNKREHAGILQDYFIPMKKEPHFRHLKVGSCRNVNYSQGTMAVWERDVDTEAKLLEEMYERYHTNPYVIGKIQLYTHYEPCLSCDYEIIQFMQYFENIEMEIYFYKTYTTVTEVS